MRPLTGWTSLGQPLGLAGIGHQALFYAALAFAVWMVAMMLLAAAVAIPFRLKAPPVPTPIVPRVTTPSQPQQDGL